MGTPDFAVHSLSALLEAGHEICGVFTREDKPKGRGMRLVATPVKEYALERNIPVFTPKTLRDGAAMEIIERLAPELIAVTAYGRLLPKEMLDYPRYGCINVHASLLPKYRGAAPINWAVINGEPESGVTIMHMAEEMDAGDMILKRAVPITAQTTAPSLWDELGPIGGALLVEAIAQIAAGTAPRAAQDASQMSLAPMLTRACSPLDTAKTASQLDAQVRGLLPWPAATITLAGRTLKVFASRVSPQSSALPAGSILQADKRGLFVVCGGGTVLELLEIQGEGGKRMSATAYLLGKPFAPEELAT